MVTKKSKNKINLAFWIAILILVGIVIWSIWATETHNLPCNMAKGLFTINGTEYQNYIQRCKW